MEKKILSVDDSSSIRKMVAYTLKSQGYAVTSAADGQEALETLAKERFDGIVLDINMPRLDGFTLLKKIRAETHTASIPVIMLTTEGQERDKQEATALGADAYVVKPFKPSELVRVVQDIVGPASGIA